MALLTTSSRSLRSLEGDALFLYFLGAIFSAPPPAGTRGLVARPLPRPRPHARSRGVPIGAPRRNFERIRRSTPEGAPDNDREVPAVTARLPSSCDGLLLSRATRFPTGATPPLRCSQARRDSRLEIAL